MGGRGGGGGRGGRQGGGAARGGGGGRGGRDQRPGRAGGGGGGGRQGWGGGQQGGGGDSDKPRGRPPQPPRVPDERDQAPAPPPEREQDRKGGGRGDEPGGRGGGAGGGGGDGDSKREKGGGKAGRAGGGGGGKGQGQGGEREGGGGAGGLGDAAKAAAGVGAAGLASKAGAVPQAKAAAKAAAGTSVEIGSTENKPELLETIPITAQVGAARHVLLSLGADSDTDSPLPEIAAGDRLEVFAELELTTDADDPNHPGLVGHAYSYAPEVEATLLLAADATVTEAGAGRAVELAAPWHQAISHERHHGVVTFGDGAISVPPEGLPWQGAARINLVVSASHPEAAEGDVLLVGQNEKTPVVVQDMAGIRVVRHRPGGAAAPPPESQTGCLCSAVPISKARTVVLSHELAGLQVGERLAVKARLRTDAAGLAGPARISTRLFIADSPTQDEPGGSAAECVTWKGNLSKYTGFNCLPAEGPMTSSKYGVATVRQAPAGSLYVNLVAVSAAPFGGVGATDALSIDTAQSALEVTRFPPPAG